MFYIHKGTVSKSVKTWPEDKILQYLQDGWEQGKCKKHWITDGSSNKLLPEGARLPEGFWYGQSEEFKQKNRDGNLKRWKNTSEEKRAEIALKISRTIQEYWDNATEEDKATREQHRLETRDGWTEDQIKDLHLKLSQSAIKNRKTVTEEEYFLRSKKSTVTKKRNGTFSTSSFEEKAYGALCEAYGKDNVDREFIDDIRYPFKCDFHVQSNDQFIELNIHPSHNSHPYNEDDVEDLKEI